MNNENEENSKNSAPMKQEEQLFKSEIKSAQ